MATNGFITIEQLVDIVQQDLTFSGLFEKILPDREIKRIVKEHALEWFYNNYQYSTQKSYFFIPLSNFQTDLYTQYKYFVLPEEIQNVTRIFKLSDPSLFRLGIQAPHLSINLGVVNQPFLTSFISTIGDLAVYRSVISAFSDEINKMTKSTLKFDYNYINHRLHILTSVDTSLMIETYVKVQQEEMFDNQLFKDYVIGTCRKRTGEALGRMTFQMPGNFGYNAADMIAQGDALITTVVEKIKGETQSGWFIMSR